MKVNYLKIIITLSFCLFLTGCNSQILNMIQIPGNNYSISQTEITQYQFKKVMGFNPSYFTGNKNLPVENVSWYDTLVFCNKLSLQEHLTPVYSINDSVDPQNWNYTPCKGERITQKIDVNYEANGYRIPKKEEWMIASKGGQDYRFPGSDTLTTVAWYSANSDKCSHEVATKKPNGYGLYDMAGNVLEWVWESNNIGDQKFFMGGCWNFSSMYSACNFDLIFYYPNYRSSWVGFRVAKTI